MEENNGIKIKAYMIYSMVMLPAIVIGVYYEVHVIKKVLYLLRWGTGLRPGDQF